MANSKEVVAVGSVWSPEFIDDLLPCSQRISLLYHLSYLYLGKFPKLEKLLRMRAVETQLLFGSSEALLLKCVGTSQNLISSLFPMLILAIENDIPSLAEDYLKKARTWITEIIQDVNKMVERYGAHNKDIASTTSDIKKENSVTEKQFKQLSKEIEIIKEELNTLEGQRRATTKELEEKDKQVQAKNQELRHLASSVASESDEDGFLLDIFAIVVPFIGPLVKYIYDNYMKETDVAKDIRAVEGELTGLYEEKNFLKQQEWNLQVQIMDWNMKLAKHQTDQDSIPNPVHLREVQRYLTRIQKILIKLQGFWEKVNSLLGYAKNKTFVDEHLFKYPQLKDNFVRSIQNASEVWGQFSGGCIKGIQIFRVQSKDAYNFLEIDPASLSQEVWQKEYDRVIQQLQQLG